jgi:hypothetical protein
MFGNYLLKAIKSLKEKHNNWFGDYSRWNLGKL